MRFQHISNIPGRRQAIVKHARKVKKTMKIAVIPPRCGRDVSPPKFFGVGLTLITKDVIFRCHHVSCGKPRQ